MVVVLVCFYIGIEILTWGILRYLSSCHEFVIRVFNIHALVRIGDFVTLVWQCPTLHMNIRTKHARLAGKMTGQSECFFHKVERILQPQVMYAMFSRLLQSYKIDCCHTRVPLIASSGITVYIG